MKQSWTMSCLIRSFVSRVVCFFLYRNQNSISIWDCILQLSVLFAIGNKCTLVKTVLKDKDLWDKPFLFKNTYISSVLNTDQNLKHLTCKHKNDLTIRRPYITFPRRSMFPEAQLCEDVLTYGISLPLVSNLK